MINLVLQTLVNVLFVEGKLQEAFQKNHSHLP